METAYVVLLVASIPLTIVSIWLSIFRPGQRKTFIVSIVVAGVMLASGLLYLTLPNTNLLGASFVTVLVPGIWAALAASDYRDYRRKAAK